MSYLDRLQESIELTSPEGSAFSALWSADTLEVVKKLGVFEYPSVKGAVVQDLEVGGDRYSFSVYFSGQDYDIEKDRFFKACKEKGLWQILHPNRGQLFLQLISVKENNMPIESGNMVKVDTEWIEPLPDSNTTSLPQLQQTTVSNINAINTSSASQLTCDQTKFSYIAAITLAAEGIIEGVLNFLLPFLGEEQTKGIAKIIIRSLKRTIQGGKIDLFVLARQVQQLIQLPVLASTDLSRFSFYRDFYNSLLEITFEEPTPENRNASLVQELAMTACIAALSNIAVTSSYKTRTEAVNEIDALSNDLNTITTYLDNVQGLFVTEFIDKQYFSQSQSYSDSLLGIALSQQYLLKVIFDLTLEKRFILKTREAPIITTINEYSDPEFFDFFIASNELKSDEILLLPAGKEVVVYV